MIDMARKPSKRIPTGRVFRRKYRYKGRQVETTTFYLQYYAAGKRIEESTGTDDYDEALAVMREKMAKVSRMVDHGGDQAKVQVGHLFDLLLNDYKLQRRSTLYDTELRVDKHLRPFFGEKRAAALSSAAIREYIELRQHQKASAATINKELAFVRRAMNLGRTEEPPLVDRVPRFKMLPVNDARSGIVSHEQYRSLRDLLPAYARIALVIGYHTGARKGEILSIRLEHVDLKAKRILRPASATKNKRPRYLPIYGDMAAELDMAVSAANQKCAYLLQHEGERVHSFRKSWETACAAAEIADTLFHDLRRTAATNMIEAGFSEKEAMEITGHRTRSMFDRYHIVSERRLKALGDRMGAALAAKDVEAKRADKPQGRVS